MNNLYEILETESNVSKENIKKQFHKLSKQYHPDKNNSQDSKEKFIKIKEAYDILIDDEKRKIYDYQQKFNYLRDFDLNDYEIIYLTEMYEKITSTNEAKFIKILYNTLPDHIKNRMQRFSDNLFTTKQRVDSKELIVPPKYINIEKLDEDFTITLNIDISDIYKNTLKRIIIHTKGFICYLFLRTFKDIKIKNGKYNFHLNFNILSKGYQKYKNHLIIHKDLNIYELLFKNEYEIILPDNKKFIFHKKRNKNTYAYKDLGFVHGNKRGFCIIIFNLDYSKDFTKDKDRIKEIFN